MNRASIWCVGIINVMWNKVRFCLRLGENGYGERKGGANAVCFKGG